MSESNRWRWLDGFCVFSCVLFGGMIGIGGLGDFGFCFCVVFFNL